VIPQQLTLKNFLSYREATLSFRGLHVACICGANGAGKSSLLEAIAWAVWGQSRASTEDDIINQGSMEALVDFTFQCHDQTYRIIRSRYRGQATTLEFQVLSPPGFRSLTERGVRATQQIISQHLRLDYDTFINSAYLRQGRADEFMLKRPSDRKQILADLLKLNQYDEIAEQAKEKARQFKAELTVLERNLEELSTQLRQGDGLAIEAANLRVTLTQMQQQQTCDGDRLRKLQQTQQQRQDWQQQLTVQQQQQQHLQQDCQRLQQDLNNLQQQQRQLENILAEGKAIAARYAQYHTLQAEEEVQTAKFQTYQAAQTQRQQLLQEQAEQISILKDQLRQAQVQQDALHQQQQENQQILSKADEIATALEQLQQARARLSELDQLQMKASPLTQRRHQLQTQLDRAQSRLTARLEELHALQQRLEAQQQQQPQLQQTLLEITQQINHLEKRRFYQQRVREKGVERRNFLERLQERQREFERELAELDQKLLLLRREQPQKETPETIRAAPPTLEENGTKGGSPYALYQSSAEVLVEYLPLFSENHDLVPTQPFPPCPLCDRPLDEQHWQHVLQHHQHEQQEIRRQIWVIREQLTTSDREIRVLRQEYRDVDKELVHYGAALERRGQLQEQLQRSVEGLERLQKVVAEQLDIERSLHQNDFAVDLAEELRLVEASLQQLNYDDKNHALARGQVDRYRWAEIKQAEIKQAHRRQAQVEQRLPELAALIVHLEASLEAIAYTPLQQQIDQIDRHLLALDYSLEQHTALRQTLRQEQPSQLRYQELLQAQHHYPLLQQRSQELVVLLSDRHQALQTVFAHGESLQQQLQDNPDSSSEIQALEAQIHQNRTQLDHHLAQLGRLQQQQQHVEAFKAQHIDLTTQLQATRHQLRIHQELSQAFGKNGLQALMIENVLPQLEAEANQILGRLSANQLHIQFVTQRSNRKSKILNPKLIETLDILISDIHGTRPYETYSGGEAFRVNFAIRLALARLLAQRSGTALQLLIVDEGFGTQDEAGCDRLISSINAIAADFACILTVTHMPHLKEAFQTRIEVYKTENGSQVRIME
jgi:exonuclease SbcC